MTKIKESSTRNHNKGVSQTACPITYVMNKIGGHWKTIILYNLIDSSKRYSELKRAIPAITEKMLVQHLKQLREENLIHKKVEQIMPPITIYSLTPSGKKLGPVLLAMADWAIWDSKLYKDLQKPKTTKRVSKQTT
jgi:DNA-binding HxlR family transcriptional regulator